MYHIQKEFTMSCSHQLTLPYSSKCSRLHGHDYYVRVELESAFLNDEGMVADFEDIDKVKVYLDHRHLNEFIAQPTAENIAKYIYDMISTLLNNSFITIKVFIKETPTTEVVYYE